MSELSWSSQAVSRYSPRCREGSYGVSVVQLAQITRT